MLKELLQCGNYQLGFPQILTFKEGPESAEIILNALGPHIRTLIRQCPDGKFSVPTCFKLVSQLIMRIRTLHEMGFVHNDIKLESIFIGNKDSDKIYLTDFGLASRYKATSGEHILPQNIEQFSANFLFASINQCQGRNTSRRDDIEACLLILVYLLNDSNLPWSDYSERFRDSKLNVADYLKKRT